MNTALSRHSIPRGSISTGQLKQYADTRGSQSEPRGSISIEQLKEYADARSSIIKKSLTPLPEKKTRKRKRKSKGKGKGKSKGKGKDKGKDKKNIGGRKTQKRIRGGINPNKCKVW
jgi:hypothetical protein